MRPTSYLAAARLVQHFASRITALAAAETPREKQARTRAINALAQHAKRLQRRNA